MFFFTLLLRCFSQCCSLCCSFHIVLLMLFLLRCSICGVAPFALILFTCCCSSFITFHMLLLLLCYCFPHAVVIRVVPLRLQLMRYSCYVILLMPLFLGHYFHIILLAWVLLGHSSCDVACAPLLS
jgi:hypothetical protein